MEDTRRIRVFSPKTGDYEFVNEMKSLPDGTAIYRSDSKHENSNNEVE